MNRAGRIAKAKARLDDLKPMYERMKKQWDKAESDLREAEKLIEQGDAVHVFTTCNRGCCVEDDYKGKVVARDTTIKSTNKFWFVQPDDGSKGGSVAEHNMKRVK